MSTSYVGSTLSVSAALPATYDSTGYAALTWTEVVGIVDVGEVGDQQNDITIDTLVGRVEHVNGSADLGEIAISYTFITADGGQVILRAGAGSNTGHSFKVEDADGDIAYFSGIVANVRDRARTSTEYKGQTCTIRGNTAVVRA